MPAGKQGQPKGQMIPRRRPYRRPFFFFQELLRMILWFDRWVFCFAGCVYIAGISYDMYVYVYTRYIQHR